MFRTATAIAVAALFCAPAMAQTLTVGQYKGTIQITGVVDPQNVCTDGNGGPGTSFNINPGQTSSSVATITGLGATWTETIANHVNNTSSSVIGAQWVNCTHTALPAVSAFSVNNVNSTVTDYVAAAATDTASCFASSGRNPKYTLASVNAGSGSTAQTFSVTILPPNGNNSAFETSATNAQLAVGTTELCNVSYQGLYAYVK